MKRTIIILLALVLAFSALSCHTEPQQGSDPVRPPIQVVVTNETYPITKTEPGDTINAGNTEAQYKLVLCEGTDHKQTTAILKVRTYDHMEEKWPDEWVTYTGTFSAEKYDKIISETPEFKEVTETWMYTVTFDTVDDPMYEPTLHVYDGMFDVKYISGYREGESYSGGYTARIRVGTTLALEVTENREGNPSALIGCGYWTY